MTNAFSDFAEAASRSSVSRNELQMPDYKRVAVLGGGEDARRAGHGAAPAGC